VINPKLRDKEQAPMDELTRMKGQLLEAEETHSAEKTTLLRLVATYGKIVETYPEFAEDVHEISQLVRNGDDLQTRRIDQFVNTLRQKIFRQETMSTKSTQDEKEAETRLASACRIIKGIVETVFEDFYPLTDALRRRADGMNTNCSPEMNETQLHHFADGFMSFLSELKLTISRDFRQIHDTFRQLLERTRELETTLGDEFDEKTRREELEIFETEVGDQVGSIMDVMTLHHSIDEIRTAVIDKLTTIKTLITARKEKEIAKAKKTQQKIGTLQKRIVETERETLTLFQKTEKLQKAAYRDGLTGLYNRAALDEKLRTEITVYQKSKSAFSLVLFDVNNFKWINDTFGHVAGDKVLKEIARTLRESFRKSDFIARYGGDEFAVVIKGLDAETARDRVTLFEKNLKLRRFISHIKNKNLNIRVSSGVAMPHEKDTPNAIIHRADRIMYNDKRKNDTQPSQ